MHVNIYSAHRFHHRPSGSYLEETLNLLESDLSWIAVTERTLIVTILIDLFAALVKNTKIVEIEE
jgi:hypothetical protein